MHCFDDKGTRPMRLTQRRTTILLCSVAVAAFATAALARPVHHHPHRAAAVEQTAMPSQTTSADRDMRYSFNAAQTASGTAGRGRHHTRYSRAARDPRLGSAKRMRALSPRSRIQTPPMAAPPPTTWCRRHANISAATRPGAGACGAAPSWTWCSRKPVTEAAATSPGVMRITARVFPVRRSAPSP